MALFRGTFFFAGGFRIPFRGAFVVRVPNIHRRREVPLNNVFPNSSIQEDVHILDTVMLKTL